jgi:hypothetical protein
MPPGWVFRPPPLISALLPEAAYGQRHRTEVDNASAADAGGRVQGHRRVVRIAVAPAEFDSAPPLTANVLENVTFR